MSNGFTVIYRLDPESAERAAKLIDEKFVGLTATAQEGNVNVKLTAYDWTQAQTNALAYYAAGVEDALKVKR